jgi:hypothetical protein
MKTTDLKVVYSADNAGSVEGSPRVEYCIISSFKQVCSLTKYYSIVFVHGLNPRGNARHSDETWSTESGLMWPRDLLPVKILYARVMIFSYNSNVAWEVSGAGIRQHANSLLDLVHGIREETVSVSSIGVTQIDHIS